MYNFENEKYRFEISFQKPTTTDKFNFRFRHGSKIVFDTQKCLYIDLFDKKKVWSPVLKRFVTNKVTVTLPIINNEILWIDNYTRELYSDELKIFCDKILKFVAFT
jgi:hypothetical protein